jgi:plastocyanin
MLTSRPLTVGLPSLPIYLLAIGIGQQCSAGTLDVQVIDADSHAIADVAVYAVPSKPERQPSGTRPTAVMDQQHNAFVPHMLIVQTGTLVDFPNNDTVSHHVYSFSEAKTFELGLYKGDPHPPVRFDRPGVVVLGCNIHDSMLGYIVVVDTPHFARTEQSGHAELRDLPPGEYTVHVWTPRARPKDLPQQVVAQIGPDTHNVVFRIVGKLLHEHDDTSLTWERY